jgi:hypothetical protein
MSGVLYSIGIARMGWSPGSPSLNLIENVWALLNGRLQKRQQDPSKHF